MNLIVKCTCGNRIPLPLSDLAVKFLETFANMERTELENLKQRHFYFLLTAILRPRRYLEESLLS